MGRETDLPLVRRLLETARSKKHNALYKQAERDTGRDKQYIAANKESKRLANEEIRIAK